MFALTRDGVRLAYDIVGDPDRPAKLALIHSLAMNRDFWRPVAERLADRAAILIYDCRGHGASDKPKQDYSTRQFAGDLADLLDHLRWRETAVAGASMGGSVALAFAQTYPQRTKALALFDTTAWYGDNALKVWAERAEKAVSEGLATLVDFQQTRWFGDKFRKEHPEVVASCVDVFLKNDPQAYAQSCRMLGSFDLRPGLSTIRQPTRIVVGEEDYATPVAMAQALHAGIEGSTLKIAKSARHLTPLEIPDAIAAELRALL